MRVLVCGGRTFGETRGVERGTLLFEERMRQRNFVMKSIDGFMMENDKGYDLEYGMPSGDLVIIHGGAKGADSQAGEWAVVHWVVEEVYEADWKQYGKSAGYIRNAEMLKKGKPDYVLAFPGGKGTYSMIGLALHAKVPVLQHDFEGKITSGS